MYALLCFILTAYFLVLLVRVILSWVPSPPEPIRPISRLVNALTDPLLTPLRRVIPPVRLGMGALDLSPLILFFAIAILQGLVC